MTPELAAILAQAELVPQPVWALLPAGEVIPAWRLSKHVNTCAGCGFEGGCRNLYIAPRWTGHADHKHKGHEGWFCRACFVPLQLKLDALRGWERPSSPAPRFTVRTNVTIEHAPPDPTNRVVIVRRPAIAMDVYGGEHLCEYPSGDPWVGPWPRYE